MRDGSVTEASEVSSKELRVLREAVCCILDRWSIQQGIESRFVLLELESHRIREVSSKELRAVLPER